MDRFSSNFLYEVKKARKNILDVLESAYGDTPNWLFIRGRVLKIFGKDGLEGLCKTGRQVLNDNRNGNF